ncbi:MAG: endopeptidase La [Ardenticatenaceae bacterium]|nr:endopeptidase La [Ardenticatenaceae bacterium]MCB9446219.1 endopeptidase La [Ardenticatenaceae bacterium]
MTHQNEFDLTQYPDFIDALPGLDPEIFELKNHLDEDGYISGPFLPLRDIVLFPQMVMPLFVGRERSLAAIQAAMNNNENLIVSAQRDSNVLTPGPEDIFPIGTEITIGKALRMPDDTNSVLGQGRHRVEIIEFTQWDPYIRVRAKIIYEPTEWERNTEALMRAVTTLFEKVVNLDRNMPEDAYTFAINIDEPGWLADFIASTLSLPLETRQDMLETIDPTVRLQKMSIALAKELDVLELEDQIHNQVQQEVERSQREHFLREQMRVIQGELGEGDIFTQELHELRDAVANKKLPDDVQAKVEKEIARLSAMPPMSPEVGIIRTYIDWIIDLPWLEKSVDNLDVIHASQVLEDDHFGLEKVKDRILEYIAVKKIAPDTMRSPILCFVGPPGTGKTSIGRSIARALGREFVRISLGGVRDEAEIRGHRRTYIGALPGRIIQAMRRAGTANPLFMLDEIDKLGQDFRGDPAAALLEVLDPEQNNSFADHYLDLDFDLSQVMFITTANMLDTIPPALQDRMEVIEFSGYLEEEKLEISRRFLIPKQLEQHGLKDVGLQFETDAMRAIIHQYTHEAGVRNLEREVANVCRKVARSVAEKKRFTKRITARHVEELLGPPRFMQEMLQEQDEVGVATGAAWTMAGGDILFIEVNLMPGKGNLTLTGQLGDIMQESAQAALSYIRSQSAALKIDDEMFEKLDIHIHIPEGAVPKDGPSAGVTMATALVSAFTNRPIRRDVAMTGEITLRGRVLPVGGVREKVLAARRAGIKTFVLPKKNESDLNEVPKKLREDVQFVLIERAAQALETALLPPPPKQRRSKTAPLPMSPPAGAPPA